MSGSVGGGPMRLVEPLFFKPLLVPRIWGGERLGVMVDGVPIGESWLFSTLANEETVVEGGSFHGLPLAELANRFGSALLGERILAAYGATFPLLVKILDTSATLSVQVHPDEAAARSAGLPCGKREAWYVLPEGDGASMFLGLQRGVTREELATAVNGQRIESLLHCVRAEAGACYEVPAGTIHALGAGNLVVELQQPSDVTYRLYDWDRRDAHGQRRELHVREAIACATLTPYRALQGHRAGDGHQGWMTLLGPPFFSVSCASLRPDEVVNVDTRGEAMLMVLTEGAAELCAGRSARWELPLRCAVLLPMQFGVGHLVSHDGGVVLACRVC